MSYKVIIKYFGVAEDTVQLVAPVCAIFAPSNAYTDTVGYANSVYNTNVTGVGAIPLTEPFASTGIPFPVPMAQFKLAMVSTNHMVQFDVDEVEQAFYYVALGKALADQGFQITVSGIDFGAVTGITDIPTTATHNTDLTLSGTVAPTTAVYKTIVWSVKTAGDTGATIADNKLSTTAAGTCVVTATIVNGLGIGINYVQDTTITVA